MTFDFLLVSSIISYSHIHYMLSAPLLVALPICIIISQGINTPVIVVYAVTDIHDFGWFLTTVIRAHVLRMPTSRY